MKKLEDLTKEELFQLCVDLMVDGADVQGMTVEDFAKEFHKIEW